MLTILPENKLKPAFYLEDVLTVARNLLGKIFVKNTYGNQYAGTIVEVEAYDGTMDEAAHTFIGKTPRNEIMFRRGGFLYVYFTYGMYFCCNVVTGAEGEGKAVLLRAVEPLSGISKMSLNRFGKENLLKREFMNLTNGPGKLCKAFDITRKDNGTDLSGDKIFILNNKRISDNNISISKRIGIKKSIDLPWRFYIKENSFISKK
jgi:DNA-3-methyladenine glycosylase